MFSEFFHKGPRPRSKRAEEKSIEGADRLDGMVAETELGSCNHVPHGAPIVKSEVDSISVISADRTPSLSVRAPACNGHASTSMHRQSPVSLNDDSPDFVAHYSVMHDPAQLYSENNSSEKLHEVLYVVNNEQKHLFDNNSYEQNHESTDIKNGPESFVGCAREDGKSLMEQDHTNALYSEINKNAKIHGIKNPIAKPVRSSKPHFRNITDPGKKVHSESKWGKASSIINVLKQVIPRSEKDPPIDNCSTLKEKSHDHNFVNVEDSQSPAESDCLEMTNHETDVRDSRKRDSRKSSRESLQELLKTYFDKTLHSKTNSEEKINLVSSESDKLLEHNEDVLKLTRDEIHDDFNENEEEPLFQNVGKKKLGRTGFYTFKSHSLEQAERHNLDALYDSDDSIGKTNSLRSHSSMRSRVSRLSNLSFASGPMVRIDPIESVSMPAKFQSLQNTPKRKLNIGYIAYSSFETETSEAPSSSVSCDSLSPRSLPSETQSDQLSDIYRSKGQPDNHSDKVARNVALGSLKHKIHKKQTTANLDSSLEKDSGVDSLPKRNGSRSINGSHDSTKVPVTDEVLNSSIPQINVTRTSFNGKDKEPLEISGLYQLENRHNGGQVELHKYGNENQNLKGVRYEGNVPENLLTPYHFLDTKTKRGALRKQQRSELDEYEC